MPNVGMRRSAVLAIVAAALACPAAAHGQISTPEGQVGMKPCCDEPRSSGVRSKMTEVIRIDNASIDRLEQWLDAAAAHEPGDLDAALETVAAWSSDDLRDLWINATAVLKLMREPKWKKIVFIIDGVRQEKLKPMAFVVTPEHGPSKEIRYSLLQTQRLKVMACAAGGERFCPEILATGGLSPALDRLSQRVRAVRDADGDNFLLRYGAMLHADAAIAAHAAAGPQQYGHRTSSSPAPAGVRVDLFDGGAIGTRDVGIHWVLARMLLDEVVPPGAKKPAPGRDPFVRDWYRATAAWMQAAEDHDTQHLDRARGLFPDNPDILFLSGCQREVFAAPRIQSAIQSANVPAGLRFDIASDQHEARRAEEFLRRAIAARPDMAEAHLHLGHVLLLRGNDSDAAAHLRQARAGLTDPLLEYYAALMLGAAEGRLARYDAARESLESAAAMQPTAQAPLIRLSELARRRGNRSGALRELQRVFALPASEPERDDPWWRYDTSHVRDADALVDSLRQSVLRAGPKSEE